MLEVFSPMRVVFAGDHASGEDDRGRSEWTLVSKTEHDLEWRKTYGVGERSYRGRKLPHAFIGVWTDPKHLRDRAGCFWLVPAHRLSARHAEKLRRAARRRFWPSGGAQAFSFSMIAASVPSIALMPWWLFPLPFALIWFALKDAIRVAGATQEISRALDEPLRARVREHDQEEEQEQEQKEEQEEEVVGEDEASSSV